MDWEKISANDMTDKGLISKIHYTNSSYNSTTTKTNPIEKWEDDLNRPTFLQIKSTNGQQARGKMIDITIREMKIKATTRYHLHTGQGGHY